MEIFSQTDSVEAAVEALKAYGLVAIEGTKTPAERFMQEIVEALPSDGEIVALPGFKNTQEHGYLYYLYDSTRLSYDESKLFVDEIDASNPL